LWLINNRFLLTHWTLFFGNEKDKVIEVGDLETNKFLRIEIAKKKIGKKGKEDENANKSYA